ncbi:MAG: ChaN family lipoprotein [Bacteroidota bacterium]
MYKFFVTCFALLFSTQLNAQVDGDLSARRTTDRADQKAPLAYAIYDSNGRSVRYNQLLSACEQADVVFFGEQHNNPISHWLTYELFQALLPEADQDRPLTLAMEMLEVHQQQLVDAYVAQELEYDSLANATDLWPNFKTDYRPVLDLARNHDYRTLALASNVTRRYASRVFKEGIESFRENLPENWDTAAYPPLEFDIPYDSRSYQEMVEMMSGHGGHGHGGHGHGESGEMAKRFVQAQAIKDATMAWRILQVLREEMRVFHVNGAFHTQYHEGIVWYIKYFAEQNKRETVPGMVTISQENVDNPGVFNEELKDKADFIIQVPNAMTKTY